MTLPTNRQFLALSLFSLLIFSPSGRHFTDKKQISIKPGQKIQVAILLDVSGSMNGLIEQAKSQLWNMVKVLCRVKCDNDIPDIEIALFEYGRPSNGENNGYIKHIAGFTKDLDKVYLELSALRTDGGEEYCGHVINTSLDKLEWDTSHLSYKVIFIAGNESFLQGNISYTTACKKAKEKGVIVNTIYCGNFNNGLTEHWNLGGECGNGSFTNIDQDAKDEYILSPFDTTLIVLNDKINKTYLYYGLQGEARFNSMMSFDTVPVSDPNDINKILNYKVVKSSGRFRNDGGWDLVSAYEKDSTGTFKFKKDELPDSLKNKSPAEIKRIVKAKSEERNQLRKEIMEASRKRDEFIDLERQKRKATSAQTLETEIEKIIKVQITRFKMKID